MFQYNSLSNIIQENNIDQIIEQYSILLSQLNETPKLSKEEFIKKVSDISNNGYIYVCYIKENENIHFIGSGTIIFESKNIQSYKCLGHIKDIIVDNDHKGMGISRTIVEILFKLAEEKNCYKVTIDIKEGLEEFYNKN
jgi:hypothetical protein